MVFVFYHNTYKVKDCEHHRMRDCFKEAMEGDLAIEVWSGDYSCVASLGWRKGPLGTGSPLGIGLEVHGSQASRDSRVAGRWLGAGVRVPTRGTPASSQGVLPRPGPCFQQRCSGEAAGLSRGAGKGDTRVHPGLHSCSDLLTLALRGLQKPPELDLLPAHKNSVVAQATPNDLFPGSPRPTCPG